MLLKAQKLMFTETNANGNVRFVPKNKQTNPKQVQNTKHETITTGAPFAIHVTILKVTIYWLTGCTN